MSLFDNKRTSTRRACASNFPELREDELRDRLEIEHFGRMAAESKVRELVVLLLRAKRHLENLKDGHEMYPETLDAIDSAIEALPEEWRDS